MFQTCSSADSSTCTLVPVRPSLVVDPSPITCPNSQRTLHERVMPSPRETYSTHSLTPLFCQPFQRYTPQKNKQRLQLKKQRRKAMKPPGSKLSRDRDRAAALASEGDNVRKNAETSTGEPDGNRRRSTVDGRGAALSGDPVS